jgi:isoleucyl-tRNA synthetase
MAPILSFTAEEVWEHVPGTGKAASVHLTDFPEADRAWLDEGVEKGWETLLRVRGEVAKALEQARAAKLLGAALDARVTLYVQDPELRPLVADEALLRELFIVAQLERGDGAPPAGRETGSEGVVLRETGVPGLGVEVRHATGAKCERCWVWSEAVGRASDHPGLCERCLLIIREISPSASA